MRLLDGFPELHKDGCESEEDVLANHVHTFQAKHRMKAIRRKCVVLRIASGVTAVPLLAI